MEPTDDLTMAQILTSIRELIHEERPGSVGFRKPDLGSGKARGDVFNMDDLSNEAAISRGGAVTTAQVRTARVTQASQGDPVLSASSRNVIGRAFETLDAASQQYSKFAGGTLEPIFSRAVQEAVAPNLQTWVNSHHAELLEAAKPLMREWMDANLPRLVESVLKEELGRAVTEHLRSRLG